MHNLKSNIIGIKAIVLAIVFTVMATADFTACGQQKRRPVAPDRPVDKYSMSLDSRFKPEMRYFLVRLKGDNGISIIDLDGNIISRNFAPVTNSKGKVSDSNYSNPVLDGIFCVKRHSWIDDQDKSVSDISIYRNPSHPTPIEGLTDLYSANIINPNLFPICRYGERIKFVDSKGNVKFTVMPIDGKEPHRVSPLIANGLIEVEVEYDVKTEDYTDNNGVERESITKSTTKYGAIDTTGKWVIYPEWDSLDSWLDGTMIGRKGEDRYKISRTGKSVKDTNPGFDKNWWGNNKYMVETFFDNGRYVSNIYDLKQNYITTLDPADYVRANSVHSDILVVRRERGYDTNGRYTGHENLVDLSKNAAVISKNYSGLEELPDGNYLGKNLVKDSDTVKCWYVKADGTATPLPDNCEFLLDHALMALYYDTDINRFIVQPKDGIPGYICDFNGNRIGNLQIQEYYNPHWEAEPVKSSYWRKHILGADD